MRGRDIEKRDFVCPGGVVLASAFNGVAGVTDVHEINALDDAPTAHVQARYDALGEHFETRIHNLGGVGQGPCNLGAG